MPLIDLTLPPGALDAAEADRLREELATILLRWEGAPDTEFFREITWLYLHEGTPAVGGRPGGGPRYRVDVTVPAGTLTQERKDGLVAGVHTAVCTAVGLDPQSAEALHVWTLIREVPEGNWGAAGQTIRQADLKKAGDAERAAVAR